MSALSLNREIMPMPISPIGTYIDQPLDVQRDLFTELPFDLVFGFDYPPDAAELFTGEVFQPHIRVYPCLF